MRGAGGVRARRGGGVSAGAGPGEGGTGQVGGQGEVVQRPEGGGEGSDGLHGGWRPRRRGGQGTGVEMTKGQVGMSGMRPEGQRGAGVGSRLPRDAC